MRLDEQFIKKTIPEASILYGSFPKEFYLSIDSRSIEQGEIFVALNGVMCDGHDFIQDALDKGASGLILSCEKKKLLNKIDKKILKERLVILVASPLEALLMLAQEWRSQFDYPVVAVTGSVGKTSTKERIASILKSDSDKYLISRGNQNTQIGLALNMVRMRAEHKAAVFEVGIGQRGQMAQRAELLKPTIALITTIGHSHMEGLGSLQEIALEKRDIFKYFDETNIGIVNGDDPLLSAIAYTHPVIKFGSKTSNQFQMRKVRIAQNRIDFNLKFYGNKYAIRLNDITPGAVQNSVAAACVSYFLNISQETIIKGLKKQVLVQGRFEHRFLPAKKGIVINDCYNANPESMKASLLAFESFETKAQKVVVLGDMLELGGNSPFWHRQLGRFLRKVSSMNHLILVGDMVKWTQKALPFTVKADMVPSWEEAVSVVKEKISKESVILVKGSRGMSLDKLVDSLAPVSVVLSKERQSAKE